MMGIVFTILFLVGSGGRFFFLKGKMHLGVHCTLLMNNSISIYHIYVVYIHMQLNWKFYSMST